MRSAPAVAWTSHFAMHRLALPPAVESTQECAGVGGPVAHTGQRSQLSAAFAQQGCWLGAVIPKRHARRAVTRNAIKRQIYAAGNVWETALGQAAHVVRLREGFDRRIFTSAASAPLKRAVRMELQQLFSKTARAVQP